MILKIIEIAVMFYLVLSALLLAGNKDTANEIIYCTLIVVFTILLTR